ncbi:MAG: DUF1015 domain-containing protein [Acidimicrobiales bacterium]|nr:DUF1015 domain-containing protein [Acidimicrobiales bacterium]
MPRFEPFRGLRYQVRALSDKGCSLDQVIAPPYDVIEPDERERLSARSAYNAVRVELPEDEPGRDRYRAAAFRLETWEAEGILGRDNEPAFYAYRMSSEVGGAARRLTGVIGALGLEPLGEGDILPHERTLPKPLGDRFELLRACQVNTSPIWGLSAAGGLSRLIGEPPPGAPTAIDDEGVVHGCWPVSDPTAVEAISSALSSQPLVIADGHHRYETALAYRAEVAGVPDRPPGAAAIMAFVVDLADDQLSVRAIHRTLHDLDPSFDLLSALAAVADLEPVGEAALKEASQVPPPATLLVAPEGAFALHWRPGRTPVELDADSSRLDLALTALPPHQLAYTHDEGAVLQAVREGRARAGFLLRPVAVGLIAEAARDRRRFPPKTSFFAPKPRTGMVFRPLSA